MFFGFWVAKTRNITGKVKAILAETTMFMVIINIVAFAANSSATKQPGIQKTIYDEQRPKYTNHRYPTPYVTYKLSFKLIKEFELKCVLKATAGLKII
ncbi:hypothetical protein AGMMS49953_02820 [Endomicrobiia bacterium]|nr:hypothetical protein AGMMS49953_02820 [Endomicrobiia bacterium]